MNYVSFVFFFAGNRERIGILETWGLVSGPGSFGSNGLGIRIPVVLFAEKKTILKFQVMECKIRNP
jgi:hypothetical protein